MDLCLVLMITSFGLGMVSTHAELQRFEQPAKTDGKLSFLVLGDWGRRGDFNQSEVAHQVLPASFVFFFNLHHFLEKNHAPCGCHFHLSKIFPVIYMDADGKDRREAGRRFCSINRR